MAASLAAVSALQPRHVFGALGARPQGLAYVDEGCLAYICGHTVVLYSPESKAQRFLAGSPEARITAFAICSSRRLLALAERGERATVTIFDLQTLKRRKILTAPADGAKEFVSLAFSGDGRFLAAQGGAPDWSLSLWVWEKSKLVAQQGHSAVQCLFQPGDDPQYLSVVGEGVCTLYTLEQGNALRAVPNAIPRRDSPCYTCHAWVADSDARELLAVGTRRGEVLVLGEGEVRQVVQLEDGAGSVDSIAATGKGLVVGTTRGKLLTFERDSDTKPYRLGRTFAIEHGSSTAAGAPPESEPPSVAQSRTGTQSRTQSRSASVMSEGIEVGSLRSGTPVEDAAAGVGAPRASSLAASPADDGVAVLTSDGQLLHLGAASGDRRGVYTGLARMAPAFHSGAITGLATCVRRAVVATAGADRTVRIWNYQDKSAELVKSFDEEVSSLALHPTGYMLLAGFADKLRLMTVLSDDLRVVKEFAVKGARECCFSRGGQYFAAVNGNAVHVWDAYTCASVAVLRGHNGKVRGLWWSCDDTTLVTAGVDGAVYEWRVLEGRRARDFVQKGWTYTSVAGMHAPGKNPSNAEAAPGGPAAIFTAALDKRLRSLEEAAGGGLAVAADVDAGAVVTQIVAPGPGGRLLFAATEEGSVRAYKLPLTPEHQAVRCGLAPITRLAASRDETTLFAATAEGALFVFDVKDRDAARLLTRREGEGVPMAEEVLVGRGDIDERRERMAELEAQVSELTAQNEYQLKLKDLALNEKVRELTVKAASEAGAAVLRYNALLADRTDLEARYEGRLREADQANESQLVALDAQFQQKLIHEMQRFQELQGSMEALNTKWETQAAALVEQHARVVDEFKATHARELAAERARYGLLATDKDVAGREAAEVRRQMEEDVDREVEELKERYRKQLQGEEESNLRLKGENGLLRKRFDEQQKAIDEGRAAIKAADVEKRQLGVVIEGLKRDVAALKRDVAGRDEAIAEKEKRILDLKHKTQELEKFKFVLEYSIGELRAQLDPKEAELGAVKEKLEEVEALAAAAGRGATEAGLELEGRKQREAALQREVARQRAGLAEAANKIRQMQCDISLAVEQIQAPDALKAAVVRLFRTHAEDKGEGGSGKRGEVGEEECDAAAKRQVEGLERSLAQLRATLDAEKRAAAANQRRLVAENAELLRQLREAQRGGGAASVLGPTHNSRSPSSMAPSRCDMPSRASPAREGSTCDGEACGGKPGSCAGYRAASASACSS